MQNFFKTALSARNYALKGIKQDIPRPNHCHQCKNTKLHKHGWYWRHCLDGINVWLIPIRRYYCPHCKITISMLPSFCLPGIQYALAVVLSCILGRLAKGYSLKHMAQELSKIYPQLLAWSPGQMGYYPRLFLKNLSRVELVLRQWNPRCCLFDSGTVIKKRAKKVLDLIPHGFSSLECFAEHFQRMCQSSFLAPNRILIVPR